MLTEQVFREDSGVTQIAFGRLLEWLDDGAPSDGARYVEIRERLVAYFERRNCPDPDELADDTFNRIARTLEEQGVIRTTPPAKYCYVVARFVLLEDARRRRRHVHLQQPSAIDATPAVLPLAGASRERELAAAQEQDLDRLDGCLQQLRTDQRELIVEYYRESRRPKIERRRELARQLGVSANALAIRVYRIREALTACMERSRSGWQAR